MLDPHPRAQLCFVIQQYGQVIITEPKRCKGMLSDLAPQHRLEINLLIVALEQKVAQELLQPSALIPINMQIDRLAKRLHDVVGIKEEFAYWAVESWALALGVIQSSNNKPVTDVYREAVNYYEQKEYDKALPLFKQTAESDNADAQCFLGFMYESGQGVAKNDAQAVVWYRKAAEQGNATAQYNLGNMYANGRGVAKDDAQTVVWYRKAAEQGFAEAQFNLGLRYFTGHQGVAEDETQTVIWFRKAAEQGVAEAQMYLTWMYEHGRGVAKNNEQAVFWNRKAAEQGDSNAQVNLGWYYMNGLLDLPIDYQKAVYWNELGTNNGHPEGFNNLGWLYENGLGVKQDYSKAAELYQNAISKGIEQGVLQERIEEAQSRLAIIKNKISLRIGKFIVQDGVATDTETGLMWCRFAHGQTWKNGTAVGNAKTISWDYAMYEASQFNEQGGYAGYTDWRLPLLRELTTLIKGKKSNCINEDVFPNNSGRSFFGLLICSRFWSSFPYSGDGYDAQFVDFHDGSNGYSDKGSSYAVRLVRGGQ